MFKKNILLMLIIAIVVIPGYILAYKFYNIYSETHQISNLVVKINEMELSIDLNQSESSYNLQTLNTEFPAHFYFEDAKKMKIEVNGEKVIGKEFDMDIKKLSRGNKIELKVNGKIYYLRTIPDNFPSLVAEGQSPYEGFYYTIIGNYAMKMDNKGEIVFYRKVSTNNQPFKRVEIEGKVRYAYLEYYNPDGAYPILQDIGYAQTHLVILDEKYNLIKQIDSMAKTDLIPEGYPLENHDFIIIDEDHYILSTYYGTKVTNIPEELNPSKYGTNVVDCVFQEIKDGKCIFEWNTASHPELYHLSTEMDDYTNKVALWADYAHYNSIVIDPKDNNFICSFRNFDSVMKIDRKTGDIIWMLGGKEDEFGLTEYQKFKKQHNAILCDDGSISIFDNGALESASVYPVNTPEELDMFRSKQLTRVLNIKLDENNKKVTRYNEYVYNNKVSVAMGSAQFVDLDNEVVLACWGSKKASMPIFSEIDFKNQKTLFEIYSNKTNDNAYRVMKYLK